MKRMTESEVGVALRGIDLRLHVYRPPDPKSGEGVSNWKPCDYMVWWRSSSAELEAALVPPRAITLPFWIEVKDVAAVNAFAFSELRQAQVAGIRDASRVGIPYWLAIWWRRQGEWSISDAKRVLDWRDEQIAEARSDNVTSIPRQLLISRFGVTSSKAQLGSTLKQVLLGEID